MSEKLDRPEDDERRECRTIGERFEREPGAMLPLPTYPFVARRIAYPEVSRRALTKVEGVHYSVPTAWAGLAITARIGPHDVELVGPAGDVVVHGRRRFGGRSIDYRHYVSELARKPQAIRQVAAELVRDLGEPYGAAWRQLLDMLGPQDAARHFARILAMIEHEGITTVAQRISRALERGEPILGIIIARIAAASPSRSLDDLPAALRDVEILSGCAADYDRWLGDGEHTMEGVPS
jgi:hypothetical protein